MNTSRRLRLLGCATVAQLMLANGAAQARAQNDDGPPPPPPPMTAAPAADQVVPDLPPPPIAPIPAATTAPVIPIAPAAPIGSPPVRPSEAAAPGDANNGARRASEYTQFGASGSPPPAAATGTGFDFGSYGRVGVGSDLRGHSGYNVNIVSYGSRLEELPYLELNFYYGGNIGENSDRRWRVIFVPAYSGDLFHYTGDFSQNFAIRNAYAEVENLGVHGLTLWAGSRMYRGDDVYLFDFWPLDNLNTVGAGAFYKTNHDRTILALHVGMNRLDDIYQYQTVQVPSRTLPPDSTVLGAQPATSTATTLDRPRLVLSFKATHFLRSLSQLPNAKLILYGEFHYLPAGERQAPQAPETGLPTDPLPADYGYVVGAQVGGWLRSFVFANIFFRYAGGLAAYGDLSTPYGFSIDRTVTAARSVTLAWSANWEGRHAGLMSAAYFHNMSDASGADDQGFNEGAVAIRPTIYFTKYLHTAFEFSYQVRRPATIDQDRARYLLPMVFRGSIMPIVAPLGQGTYSRPILYAIYTLSVLNDDAQYYKFPAEDIRSGQTFAHYLGVGVEWWFNSSYR